jgi:type II secretory pathway component PulJ
MKTRRAIQNGSEAGGFTLVELLVSVTLVAMIALCLWGVLRISISSWKRGTEVMDENQRRRATLDLVQKQMASVSGLIPPIDLQTGAGQAPIFFGTSTNVQFVSLCSLRFRDNPGLTSVTYEILPGDLGEYSLVERENRYLGGDPTLETSYEGGSSPATTIVDRLAGAAFEYFDPGTNDVPAQWMSDWDAQEMTRLPAAIAVTLSTRDTAGTLRNRRIVIPIMAEPDNMQGGFLDPFEGRRGAVGTIDLFSGRGNPGGRGGRGNNPGDRRGGPGGGNPPGGRRGGDFGPPGGRGPGMGFPPGGGRGPGMGFPPGGGRGGRY